MSRAFYHHLEVVTFFSDFVFSFVPGPFLRADEDLGRYGEVVDLFESRDVGLTHVIFQFQYYGEYPLGLNDTPNAIDFCIVLFSYGFLLCVELEVGIHGVGAFQVPEHVPRIGVKNIRALSIVISSE